VVGSGYCAAQCFVLTETTAAACVISCHLYCSFVHLFGPVVRCACVLGDCRRSPAHTRPNSLQGSISTWSVHVCLQAASMCSGVQHTAGNRRRERH
jgi:hypothetical protein